MKNLQRLVTRRALPVLLSIGLMGAGAAFAQGPAVPDDEMDRPAKADRWAGHGDGFAGFDRLGERLDLTTEQRDGIRRIREAGRARDLPLHKQMMRLRNEMRGELLKDDPSEKTALALTRQVGDLRTQIQTNRLQDRLAMRKLLTPEQRDRALMMGAFGRGGRGGHGRGPGGEAGPRGGRPGRGPGDVEGRHGGAPRAPGQDTGR